MVNRELRLREDRDIKLTRKEGKAYADGALGRDAYAAAARALQARIDGLRSEVSAREAARASAVLAAAAVDLEQRWALMAVVERRDVLAVWVDHVTVAPAANESSCSISER